MSPPRNYLDERIRCIVLAKLQPLADTIESLQSEWHEFRHDSSYARVEQLICEARNGMDAVTIKNGTQVKKLKNDCNALLEETKRLANDLQSKSEIATDLFRDFADKQNELDAALVRCKALEMQLVMVPTRGQYEALRADFKSLSEAVAKLTRGRGNVPFDVATLENNTKQAIADTRKVQQELSCLAQHVAAVDEVGRRGTSRCREASVDDMIGNAMYAAEMMRGPSLGRSSSRIRVC